MRKTSIFFLGALLALGSLFMIPSVFASAPTATLSTPGGGITSITGSGTTTGSEAGSHSIVITDATASSLTGTDVEDNTVADTIAVPLAGTEVLTVTIGGTAVTTAALAPATPGSTTLTAVATDIQTKLNAATTAPNVDVAVTVVGSSPAKTFKVTVTIAGTANSITTTFSGTGAGLLGLTTTPVAGTNATAVDTFTAATGSNGLFVAANPGSTRTVAHAPAAGTASTLAGLKTALIVASAMIEGITINATGDLSAGTAVITQAAGNADATGSLRVTGTATMVAGTTNELTVTAYDDAANRATGYTGAKTITFSGPAVLGACTASVEGTNIGSGGSFTFASGVLGGTAATFTACASEDVSIDATDGTVSSAGNAAYGLDLTVNPAAITALSCTNGTANNTVGLAWTNPAGVNNGYEVKYSTSPIDTANYASATTYTQAWASGTVGAANTQTASSITSNTLYYFVVKALGLNSNESALSNLGSCVAPPFGSSSGTSTRDTAAPTSRITTPASNGTVATGVDLVIKGTAKDNGTSSVQKVELSLNGGTDWVLATITNSDINNLIWQYTWAKPQAGTYDIMVRSMDWMNNVETPISQKLTVSSTVVTTPSGVAAPGLQTAPGLAGMSLSDKEAAIQSIRQQLIVLIQKLIALLLAERQ